MGDPMEQFRRVAEEVLRLSISSGATGSRRGTAILTGRWRKPPIPLSSASRTERRIAFPVDMEKSEIRIRGFRHRNREKTA